jgi:hypothetical protein
MSLSALGRAAREHTVLSVGLEDFDPSVLNPETQRIEDADYQAEDVAAQTHAEGVQSDVEALAGETVALEAYLGILTQADAAGGMTAAEAKFLHVGLRSYTRKTGIVTGVASVEDFNGLVGSRRATTVSVESLKEHASRAWEAFKMALKAAMAAMADWYEKTFSGASKVVTRAKALKQQLNGLRGAPDSPEFELSNASNYCVDGKFVGQDLLGLTELVDYFTKAWGSNLLGVVTDFNKLVKDYKFEDLNYQSTVMGIMHRLPAGGFVDQDASGDSRFRKDTVVKRSPTLPGNVALYQTTPAKEGDDSSVLAAFGGVAFRIVSVVDAAAAPSKVSVSTAQTSTLNKRLDDVLRMCAQLEKLSGTKAKVEAAMKETVSALDSMRANADKRDAKNQSGSGAFIDAESTMTTAINTSTALQRLVTTDFNGVLSYCVRQLAAQVTLVQAEMDHYGATSAAPGRALPSPT